MEGSSEVQHEEDKALPDKNSRRRFKTPSQLQALEDFYNEHKYPTESMKAELAENLGLTEKQISGWFCHRRLKDKRRDEALAPGRQGLSSSVIQDRGSGLRQDSCSSTKQGDYRVADLREVESRRFCQDDIPSGELNYEPRRLYDGAEIDDTSSQSNSAQEESFCPRNTNPLDVETSQYRAPAGVIPETRRRVGPSGYLKIKGQTENTAITAVKRQLGMHYQENGPPLGIEFDPLPPGAFESPSKITNNDAYRVQEQIASRCVDNSSIRKRPGFGSTRDQEMDAEATQHRPSNKLDQDNFSYRQSELKHSFPTHSRVIPIQKSSSGVDSYSARETTDSFPYNHPQQYRGKLNSEPEEPWSPSYDDLNRQVIRKRELLDCRPAASLVRHKVPIGVDDRVPLTRVLKGEEPYVERRPVIEHHDSVRFKMCPTKDLRAGKRGREGFMQEDYAIKASSREAPQWSRQIKGSTMEIPSSFSEDETAETSSSVD